MSYKIYITDAVVCGSEDRNTADRSYLLFTRDAGMVYASAKSVRKEESKHRYALQECSHIKVTLVRGQTGWRIIGTESFGNFYARTVTRTARHGLRESIRILRRLMHGEVSHPEIFDDLVLIGSRLSDPYESFEQVFILRVLYTLGYIAPKPMYASLLQPVFPYDVLPALSKDTLAMCAAVAAQALIESQL